MYIIGRCSITSLQGVTSGLYQGIAQGTMVADTSEGLAQVTTYGPASSLIAITLLFSIIYYKICLALEIAEPLFKLCIYVQYNVLHTKRCNV